ncbi:hypothetical protein MUP65_01825, partial [Patescibacteria group bacterium]|nr:hypothetical protein [Patescibacteria group bacterium]
EIARSKKKKRSQRGLVKDCLFFGIKKPLKETYGRIDQRVTDRLQAGAETEVRQLVKKYGWNSILSQTIGYQEWRPYFEGKKSRREAIEAWRLSEHGYARRQQTWFKKEKDLHWLRGEKNDLYIQAVERIENWLSGED